MNANAATLFRPRDTAARLAEVPGRGSRKPDLFAPSLTLTFTNTHTQFVLDLVSTMEVLSQNVFLHASLIHFQREDKATQVVKGTGLTVKTKRRASDRILT